MDNLLSKHRRFVPKEVSGQNNNAIFILFILSLLFFFLVKVIPFKNTDALKEEMISASLTMQEAMEILKECQIKKRIFPDERIDINRTGLIGLEYSSITTSLGNLESKRTTTNPNFAALLVLLLHQAGVNRGDTIAMGASCSFPSLIIAMLSASKAMDLKPLCIYSLGASQWGANNPYFNWLHMNQCLLDAHVFDVKPIAVSLGGDRDSGEEMDHDGRSLLIKDIMESGITFVQQPDFEENIKARMSLYFGEVGKDGIKAFINIGGSLANIGTDSEILHLKPGVLRVKAIPPSERRGVLYEMAAKNIPVIHLLYIKGLVQRYGLEWDPVPLPSPGKGQIYQIPRYKDPMFLLITVIYFFSLFITAFVLLFLKKRTR